MNKWEKWHDSLSPQMRAYLSKQPLWHDRDMYKAIGLGFVFGFVIGFLTRI